MKRNITKRLFAIIMPMIMIISFAGACTNNNSAIEDSTSSVSISKEFYSTDIEDEPEQTAYPETEVSEDESEESKTDGEAEEAEVDAGTLQTIQVQVSSGKFLFSINDFYETLDKNVDAVRRYRNYGWMGVGLEELDSGEFGIMLFAKDFSSCGIIEFYANNELISDTDYIGIDEIRVLLKNEDEQTYLTALFSILSTFDPQIKTDLDCGILIAEMALAEDETGEATTVRNGTRYYLLDVDDYWGLFIYPDDSEETNPEETAEEGHVVISGTFKTYPSFRDEETEADSTVTLGEKNALSMAKEYISSMPFSYTGLISQLEFEGFTNEEAVYGVDNCGADWYEQAVKMAKEYLETMSFSRSGLIEQLEFEGFSYDEAVYGVDQNGY